jgi:arylformamidase
MDMDREYANGIFIPGGVEYPARWAAKAASFRATARARLDLAYGASGRQKMDVFLPEGAPRGMLMFIHGGYWHLFGRETWSHLAAGAVARGWACAIPSYTLAPAARITAMVAEVADAAQVARGMVAAGPFVVTGHSAGGHLAARLAYSDVAPGLAISRVVPISPLADLEPLMATSMNATLGIDKAEAALQSPARLPLRPGTKAHVWVGGAERPAFLWHARTLSEAWACDWTVEPGRHHMDVIEGMEDPASPLMQLLLGGV